MLEEQKPIRTLSVDRGVIGAILISSLYHAKACMGGCFFCTLPLPCSHQCRQVPFLHSYSNLLVPVGQCPFLNTYPTAAARSRR